MSSQMKVRYRPNSQNQAIEVFSEKQEIPTVYFPEHPDYQKFQKMLNVELSAAPIASDPPVLRMENVAQPPNRTKG